MTSIVGRTQAQRAAREKERQLLAFALILSALVHWGIFAAMPEFRTTDVGLHSESLLTVDVPPEVEIPPPPEAIARPAAPVVSDVAVQEDVTIAPTTFESNPVDLLPPPPNEDHAIGAAPTFTPMTVRPKLKNTTEVANLLQRSYPPVLREAGIGGTVLLWIFIDEEGVVQKAQVKESSGYTDFDKAAVAVAPLMEFSPAYNRDTRVKVWISLDLVFEVLEGV